MYIISRNWLFTRNRNVQTPSHFDPPFRKFIASLAKTSAWNKQKTSLLINFAYHRRRVQRRLFIQTNRCDFVIRGTLVHCLTLLESRFHLSLLVEILIFTRNSIRRDIKFIRDGKTGWKEQ